jgi:hypothetical protein
MIKRAASLIARLGGRRTVLLFRTDSGTRTPSRAPRSEVVEVSADRFDRFGPFEPEVRALVRRRLSWTERANDRCFVQRWQGRVRACGWVRECGEVPIDEAGISLCLGATDVCLFDFFVEPSSRGNGLYADFLAQLRARFAPRTALVYCEAENVPSLRGIVRAGFRPVTEVRARHLAGWVVSTAMRMDPPLAEFDSALAHGVHAAATGGK